MTLFQSSKSHLERGELVVPFRFNDLVPGGASVGNDVDASQHPAKVFHDILTKILSLDKWQDASQTIY